MTIRENIMIRKDESDYDKSYEVDKADLKKWKYEKGEKREFRIRKTDLKSILNWQYCMLNAKSKHQSLGQTRLSLRRLGTDGSYNYNEGAISFPDSIDKASQR